MKFIDEYGRIKGKISIVDVSVIVLIVLGILAVGFKFTMPPAMDKKGEKNDILITYQVMIQGIRDFSVNAIKENFDGILDAETKVNVGKIVNMDVKPWRVMIQTNSGEYILKEYDSEKYTAVITLQCDGIETEDGYFTLSGRRVVTGETVGFDNGHAQFFAEIINTDVRDKEGLTTFMPFH